MDQGTNFPLLLWRIPTIVIKCPVNFVYWQESILLDKERKRDIQWSHLAPIVCQLSVYCLFNLIPPKGNEEYICASVCETWAYMRYIYLYLYMYIYFYIFYMYIYIYIYKTHTRICETVNNFMARSFL